MGIFPQPASTPIGQPRRLRKLQRLVGWQQDSTNSTAVARLTRWPTDTNSGAPRARVWTSVPIVSPCSTSGVRAPRSPPGAGWRPTRRRLGRTDSRHPQRQPDRRTDGTATCSLSTRQRRLRRDGLPGVGTSTIPRLLQDAGSSYQRTRTWCPTGTAQRRPKAGVVTMVDPDTERKPELAYRSSEPGRMPVWCQDEVGPYRPIPHPGQAWRPKGWPVAGTTSSLIGKGISLAVRLTAANVRHPIAQQGRADPARQSARPGLRPTSAADGGVSHVADPDHRRTGRARLGSGSRVGSLHTPSRRVTP